MTNQFLTEALTQIPRLLSQLNRNPGSKTYGSFDRAYWHYRTNDISCARYQEATYTLALLYCHDFEGNVYYKEPRILEWIRASLRFTVRLQKPNGSFDEWYVHEGSFVATAFVTSALAQTILLLREHTESLPEAEQILVLLDRASTFLISTKEDTVLNQVSGAICGVALTGKLLNNKIFVSQAEKMLCEFLLLQHEEGWWSEYGGPDIGYLSLTVSYLNKYQNLKPSEVVSCAIQKAKHFIELFIHPDMTAGGEYMSRNTEYLIPSHALPYLGALRPSHLDDRYLCYILYNWIETGVCIEPKIVPQHTGITFFSGSGLLRVTDDNTFFVANGMKGGAFRLYHDGKTYYDSGIEIHRTHEVFSTGLLNTKNQVTYKGDTLCVSGHGTPIREPLLSTKIMLPFKCFQFLFGGSRLLQRKLKTFLRRKMISGAGSGQIPFTRTIDYGKTSIIITDVIFGATTPHDILWGVKAAYTTVPSSKYAPIPEIASCACIPTIQKTEEKNKITIKRTFSW